MVRLLFSTARVLASRAVCGAGVRGAVLSAESAHLNRASVQERTNETSPCKSGSRRANVIASFGESPPHPRRVEARSARVGRMSRRLQARAKVSGRARGKRRAMLVRRNLQVPRRCTRGGEASSLRCPPLARSRRGCNERLVGGTFHPRGAAIAKGLVGSVCGAFASYYRGAVADSAVICLSSLLTNQQMRSLSPSDRADIARRRGEKLVATSARAHFRPRQPRSREANAYFRRAKLRRRGRAARGVWSSQRRSLRIA